MSDSDITVEADLNREFDRVSPDVVIHLAAMTDVDECEAFRKKAFSVNVDGTLKVVEACKRIGAKLFYISTCHVFNGKKQYPYLEDDFPTPRSIYGMSKWQGEIVSYTFGNSVSIIRLSKIFSSFTPLARTTRLPTFIIRSYTHIDHFSKMMEYAVNNYQRMPTYLNLCAKNSMSMYEFQKTLHEKHGLFDLVARREEEDITKVFRPHNGALDMTRAETLGFPMFTVEDGIELI